MHLTCQPARVGIRRRNPIESGRRQPRFPISGRDPSGPSTRLDSMLSVRKDDVMSLKIEGGIVKRFSNGRKRSLCKNRAKIYSGVNFVFRNGAESGRTIFQKRAVNIRIFTI